jgi:hypothetical protein
VRNDDTLDRKRPSSFFLACCATSPWEVVAQYLGDKLSTVLNHYVRAGEDALRHSVNKLSER